MLTFLGGERCNVSKLSVASPKTVLEKIVNVEKMELQRQLEEARSEQVCAVIKLLMSTKDTNIRVMKRDLN